MHVNCVVALLAFLTFLLFCLQHSVRPAPLSHEREALDELKRTDYSIRISLNMAKSGQGKL